MDGICNSFKMKGDRVADTEDYLGDQLLKMEANDSTGSRCLQKNIARLLFQCQRSIGSRGQ